MCRIICFVIHSLFYTPTKTEISYAESTFLYKIKSHAYSIKIRAYLDLNGVRHYSDYSDIQWLTPPKVKRSKVVSGKLNIKWEKVTGATGYDVYVSTSKNKGYKKVKSVGKSTQSIKVSKFKGKKINKKNTYYVYVVAKKKVGKNTYKSIKVSYWNTKNSSKASF